MRERQLFSSPLFGIAEFACPPQDEAWRDVNVIESASPLVVFPHVPVGIRPDGAASVLATPNLVMLYNPGQTYERRLRHRRGDECLYVALHPRALEELQADRGTIRNGRMTATHAPAERLAYLQQHLLGRHLRSAEPDALLVEETTMRLVRSAVRQRPEPTRRRERTTASHVALTESAKELLASSLAEQLGLHDVAARLDVSPFHLARVFRSSTGFSLHQYRTQLRLRLALERLPESAGALTPLAFELGFASHSHFTDTFRRAFGVAPSAVRDDRQVRRLLAA
jgi:AraC family transcriptional regulator